MEIVFGISPFQVSLFLEKENRSKFGKGDDCLHNVVENRGKSVSFHVVPILIL